ncbi:MAG: hypothetical protein EOO77_27365 [Oxalobacteraceae bacterium]|jgi:endoglucanase|nr:MAG: hypothetical protein EOO77_27365 [Oxalobacteraceae bacterium]
MRFPFIAALLLLATTASVTAGPVVSSASRNVALGGTPLFGVNLSGCEFVDNGALCPTPATVRMYLAKGFRVFRLPFRGTQANDPVVIAKMKAAADAAAAGGGYIILDRHDYGATFDPTLAIWWGSLIKNFPDSDHVMIDTMNEPKIGAPYERNVSGISYATQVNAAIAAFRQQGFRHRLLIEWRGWSGMQSFDKYEPDGAPCKSAACSFDRAGGLKDPLGRTMLSGHRYPDLWGSGTEAACVADQTGAQLLANAENGAAKRGLKIWIGEFAFGNAKGISAACNAIGRSVIERIRSRSDVYAGVSWWGGGPGWKEDYIYKIEPPKGTFPTTPDSAYLKMLSGK